MKARYTFTIDPDVIEALNHMAEGGHRSRSSMIELAVMEKFDRWVSVQKTKLEARREALAELKKEA